MGIKHQLVTVLAVVISGFIGIGFAYQAALTVDNAAFADAQNLHLLGELIDHVGKSMAEAEAAKGRFLLTSHLDNVEQYREALIGVDQDIDQLSQLAPDSQSKQLVIHIRERVHNYKASFDRLVQLKQNYGLNAQSGQIGQLHQAARDMEEVLKQYGASVADLMTSMLLMRRSEKDYIAYRKEEDLNRITAERSRFELFMEGGALLQDDKDQIAPRLIDYHNAFSKLVDTLQKIDAEDIVLNQTVHDLEPVLAALQTTKDQLLQQGQTRVSAARTQISQIFVGVITGVGFLASIMLFLTIRAVLRPLGGEPIAIATLVKQVANGDLSAQLTRTGKEHGIYAAVRDMTEQWRRIVTQVRETSLQVGISAQHSTQESIELSRRAEAQAVALEQTASSMEQLTSTVANSADHAAQAKTMADSARARAEQGEIVVRAAIEAMGTIHASSQRISAIISVIDEIAFQTNLLALNAAVEAARAGEHGRSFAIVAAEVRKLAQRSTDAAKDIKTLINDSVVRILEGRHLVEQSGQTLQAIILEVRKVTEVVAEIAAATREQACGIDQINQAVQQMDQVTQQNAALAEDATTASQAMNEQASKLQRLIDFFRLSLTEDTAPKAPLIEESTQQRDAISIDASDLSAAAWHPAIISP